MHIHALVHMWICVCVLVCDYVSSVVGISCASLISVHAALSFAALGTLLIGVVLVLQKAPSCHDSRFEKKGGDPVWGAICAITMTFLSGFAGIYFEKVLKGKVQVNKNAAFCASSIPSYITYILLTLLTFYYYP